MKFFHDWGIPMLVLLGWAALIFLVIPPLMNRLKRKAEESQHDFNAILLSALGMPLLLFLLGIGLNVVFDMFPSVPAKWEKYFDALLLILFVAAGYLFFDRLMMRVLRRYSKTVDVVASTAGVIKTLYRSAILIFAAFIVLDRLKITITPFLASLGIGGLVVALALQDTISNFFSGIYLYFDKPVRIGDYVKLESGEEGYITQVGWHSTRIQMISNNVVIVSNTKLAGNRITNFYLPDREMDVLVKLGVAHQSDLDKVEKITIGVAKEILNETEGGVKEFEPVIRYTGIDESGINFSVTLRAREYADQYLIIHEFIKRLHRRYRTERIEMPSPDQAGTIRRAVSERENRDAPEDS